MIDIPDKIMGLSLVSFDNQTFLFVDDVKKGRVDFSDEQFQSCIACNFQRGKIEMLRLCAKELTNSQKDFHIVNEFIDELEKVCDISTAQGSIEVVE
jgi:hypothetical protein